LLLQAANQVTEARRILGYTYVFAFHMFGDCMYKDEINRAQNEINKNLFESQQQAMESLVPPPPPGVKELEDCCQPAALGVLGGSLHIARSSCAMGSMCSGVCCMRGRNSKFGD